MSIGLDFIRHGRGASDVHRPTRSTMRFPTLITASGALGIVLAAIPLFATEQARDTITFAGQQSSILERPLNDFLGRLPEVPRFDISNTANYKGYTASWEVKDARLLMATFRATTKGRPYSISLLFPGHKLPIHADWYSGTVHIISGRETLAHGRYTYEAVTTLQVTNGVVIATNRLAHVREDKFKR